MGGARDIGEIQERSGEIGGARCELDGDASRDRGEMTHLGQVLHWLLSCGREEDMLTCHVAPRDGEEGMPRVTKGW